MLGVNMKHTLPILLLFACLTFFGCQQEPQPTPADPSPSADKGASKAVDKGREPVAKTPQTPDKSTVIPISEVLPDYPDSRLRDDMEDVFNTDNGVATSLVSRLTDDSPKVVKEFYFPMRKWKQIESTNDTTYTLIAEEGATTESVSISEEDGVTYIVITRTIVLDQPKQEPPKEGAETSASDG